ncbi:MAG: rod shape-determining protein RodA [bacterium]
MSVWRFLSPLKKLDWLLLAVAIFLVVLGLTALYSVSLSLAGNSFFNFQKQIIFFLIGLILFFLVCFVNYKIFKSLSGPIYLLAVILLVGVLFFGRTIRGTTGWFDFGFFNLQPVEFAKLALIVFLGKYFSDRRETYDLRHLMITGLAAVILIALVFLQPDLGSALVLLLLWLGLLLVLGAKRLHLLSLVLLICLLSVMAWFFVLEDYQKDRLITFVSPAADPLGIGYNIKQSIIAIGSGRLWGQGLSFGSQSQLKFLPESQTDFVFAVIAEELGLLGVVLVLVLWAVIFYRLIKAARQTSDDFGSIIIIGLVILLVIQVFINIGTNLGLVPVTGISLPLVSYGGSSLIIFLVMIGLAQSVIIRGRGR